MEKSQRKAALRRVSAYRNMSTNTVLCIGTYSTGRTNCRSVAQSKMSALRGDVNGKRCSGARKRSEKES